MRPHSQIPPPYQNYDFILPRSLLPLMSPLPCTLTTSHSSAQTQRRPHSIPTTTSLHHHQQPSFPPQCLQIDHQLYGLIPQPPTRRKLHQSLYQLSPFTITPTNIFANYSKEHATWWYVGRRAAARAAEKLAGYVSKGLKSALEAVPSVTTKILSFALMEEKMYYRPIYSDNPYKGCFKCFCSLPNLPLMIDHPDKILPKTCSPPLTSSSRSDITPHHDKEDSFYTPHSPTPSPPTSPPPIDISPSPTPSIDPLLPGF